MKSIIVPLCLILSATVSCITIDCTYSNETSNDWKLSSSIYCCNLNAKTTITSANTEVGNATGNHTANMTDADVKGINLKSSTGSVINHFPKGLEKIFASLIVIDINSAKLKEIHQSDLKVFPKLKALDLYSNEIEVIEEGLFDYNLELEVIWLSNNKIYKIHTEVFSKLNLLSYLYLENNKCINSNALNSTEKVKALAGKTMMQCSYVTDIMWKLYAKVDSIEKLLRKPAADDEIIPPQITNGMSVSMRFAMAFIAIFIVGLIAVMIVRSRENNDDCRSLMSN